MDKLTPEQRSRLMGRVKSRDTTPELIVRRLIHAMGFRYVLHDKRLPGRPDLVFPRFKKIIFVNGCFWHFHEGCRYATIPTSRTEFWQKKLERNRERDAGDLILLTEQGWKVLTIWQCELKNIKSIQERIGRFLGQKVSSARTGSKEVKEK